MLVYVALEGQLSHVENVSEVPSVGEVVALGEADWVITRIFFPLTSDANDLPVLNLHPVAAQAGKKTT